MQQEAQNILREHFKKLPGNVRRVLTATDLRPKLQKIAEQNSLRVDESSVLEDEVAFVLFGIEHPNRFVYNVIQHAHLDREKAMVLAEDVNKEIFTPIREELKKLWGTRVATPGTVEQINRDKLVREIEQPKITVAEDLAGLERSMPRDVQQAQGGATKEDMQKSGLFAGAEKIAEERMTKQTSSSSSYKGVDPYREPIK